MRCPPCPAAVSACILAWAVCFIKLKTTSTPRPFVSLQTPLDWQTLSPLWKCVFVKGEALSCLKFLTWQGRLPHTHLAYTGIRYNKMNLVSHASLGFYLWKNTKCNIVKTIFILVTVLFNMNKPSWTLRAVSLTTIHALLHKLPLSSFGLVCANFH